MDIRQCYEVLGGDYDQVLGRMMNKESLVQKFLLKFPEDGSYALLLSSMAAGDGAEAFRAAHTLKGVCQNLALSKLEAPVSELTEQLRGGVIPPEASRTLEEVTENYRLTTEAISRLQT